MPQHAAWADPARRTDVARPMKKLFIALLVGLALYGVQQRHPGLLQGLTGAPATTASSTSAQLRQAYEDRRSNLQVEGRAVVTRVLRDDLKDSRHQRFLMRTDDGLSLLVAHNIDLAPRVEGLREGDEIEFAGEYEWNDKGGVIHWTHHDPRGRHPGGWLKHNGRTYQ